MLALPPPWSSTDLFVWLTLQKKARPFSQMPRNWTWNDTKLHAAVNKSSSHLARISLVWAVYAVQHYVHQTIRSRKGGALCFLVAGTEFLNSI